MKNFDTPGDYALMDREESIRRSLLIEADVVRQLQEKGICFPGSPGNIIRLASGGKLKGRDLLKLRSESRSILQNCSDDAIRSVIYTFYESRPTMEELEYLLQAFDGEPTGLARAALEHVLCRAISEQTRRIIIPGLLRNIGLLGYTGIVAALREIKAHGDGREAIGHALAARKINPESICIIAAYDPDLYKILADLSGQFGTSALPSRREELIKRVEEVGAVDSKNSAEALWRAVYMDSECR